MSKIVGKYQLVQNKNFAEHLQAIGLPEDKAKELDALKPTLEIKINGKKVSLNSSASIDKAPTVLTLDEEVDEVLPYGGLTLKSIAKLTNDGLVITSKNTNGQTGKRIYKLTDTGLEMTLWSDKPEVPEATRSYKRI